MYNNLISVRLTDADKTLYDELRKEFRGVEIHEHLFYLLRCSAELENRTVSEQMAILLYHKRLT
jgi:hypothetical protein